VLESGGWAKALLNAAKSAAMDTGQTRRKILFVITMSGGGGATRYVYDIASNLPDRFEPVVVAGPDGGGALIKDAEKAGIRTHILRHLRRSINPRHDLAVIGELGELFAREQPDILHLNSSKAGIFGALASSHKYRVVYTAHGWIFKEKLPPHKHYIYSQAEKFTSRFHDRIIVLSEGDFKAGCELGIPASKLVMIRNGIREHEYLERAEARRKLCEILGFDCTDSKILLVLALFFATKGLNYLVEAIPQLNSASITVILGDGILRRQLENQIARLGLGDRVFVPGWVPQASRLLKGADVFVLPSVKEGLPFAVLEAMQAQVPIVATRVGGVPEVLDHILVDPCDPSALAQAIESQLADPQPSQRRPPDFRTMLEKTISCYNELH
jgi:glycosyltransferase involved in cell wall biosynthesis